MKHLQLSSKIAQNERIEHAIQHEPTSAKRKRLLKKQISGLLKIQKLLSQVKQ